MVRGGEGGTKTGQAHLGEGGRKRIMTVIMMIITIDIRITKMSKNDRDDASDDGGGDNVHMTTKITPSHFFCLFL